MGKKSKNLRNISILFGVIFLVGLIYYFGFSQSVIGYDANTRITNSQITDQYIKIDLSWDNTRSVAIGCGDIRDVSGNLKWNTKNIGESLGINVEQIMPPEGSSYGGYVIPDYLTELNGEKFQIQYASLNNKEINNLQGTCEFQYTYRDVQLSGIYDSVKGYTINKVRRDYYVRPTNCVFNGKVDLTNNQGCTQFPEGYVWVFNDNGRLGVTFPKDPSINCLDDSWCQSGFECKSNSCVEKQAPTPTPPAPEGFTAVLSKIINWLNDLWDNIFKQSIIGETKVKAGSTHTYQIDISTTQPDSDFSDGNYSTQFSNWALIDSEGNILKQGNWEEVNGQYTKSVTLTVPTEENKKYALIGVITQTDGVYDYQTGQWTFSEEKIMNKEAIDIKTLYSIKQPSAPIPSGFSKFISSIINWFKNIFGF